MQGDREGPKLWEAGRLALDSPEAGAIGQYAVTGRGGPRSPLSQLSSSTPMNYAYPRQEKVRKIPSSLFRTYLTTGKSAPLISEHTASLNFRTYFYESRYPRTRNQHFTWTLSQPIVNLSIVYREDKFLYMPKPLR